MVKLLTFLAVFIGSADSFSGAIPRHWLGKGARASKSSNTVLSSSALDGANLLHVAVPSTDIAAAASFYESVCGMEIQRSHESGTFVGFGSEGDGEHVALKLCPSETATRPRAEVGGRATSRVEVDDEVLIGVSVTVPDLQAALDKAESLNCTILRPFANTSMPASLVPDEDPINEEWLRPWYLRAVVEDPYSGLSIELAEAASNQQDGGGEVPRLAHVTLSVPDLDEAQYFFTEDLGMKLHRKRSLVPAEAALSAYVGFGDSETEGTLVELRYSYGRAYGKFKSKPPKQTATLALSAPDVAAAVDELSSSNLGNGDKSDFERELEGWGEALFQAQAELAEAREAGDTIKVKASKFRIEQLEYKKPTKAAAVLAGDGDGDDLSWRRAKCQVVSGVGHLPGWGEEAAILKAAHPREGLNVVLIDELDFLKQTLA